nr:unnamed protein product [Digitaria exilis]
MEAAESSTAGAWADAGAPEGEMRPAESSAAGAGVGGGDAGGRGPDEEAWREELAAAWGQTNTERGALRSQYAAVRADIRELKDDPALYKFGATMDGIEKLHEKGLVLWVSGSRNGDVLSENNLDAWAVDLQRLGPMGLGIKERRCVVRKQSGRLGSRPAEPELASDQDERNDTDKNVVVMFGLLKNHKSVKLEHLILNRQSFAQTAENLFALSFLVKDGRAEIDVVDNGDYFVAPRNAPTAKLIGSREVINSQFVFRFDTQDWKIMKRMVKPGQELMPHRSNYCGGEYKNTQSCPSVSKLGSDSEHLKEDELAKEDPVEFTNDEAMKENVGNSCPGDATLKKRKRKHVARTLSFPDD